MSFGIQFAKSNDPLAPVINTIGNGVVLASVGAGAAFVVSVALKALGFSAAAIAIGSALPYVAVAVGVGAAAYGAIRLGVIIYYLSRLPKF